MPNNTQAIQATDPAQADGTLGPGPMPDLKIRNSSPDGQQLNTAYSPPPDALLADLGELAAELEDLHQRTTRPALLARLVTEFGKQGKKQKERNKRTDPPRRPELVAEKARDV